MAQRDHNKEEPTEVRAPEITLCANRCGFPGNPATQNLCQNCFLARPASPSSSSSMPAVSVSTPAAAVAVVDRPRPAPEEEFSPPACAAAAVDLAEVKPAKASVKNRCSSCRKRVGLTGFRCRCDQMFCGEHRYSDRHGCSFDYKAAARDAIARDNPVVRAAKIVRF